MTAYSQKLKYSVKLNDEEIGVMSASREKAKNIKYLVESEIKVEKIMEFNFFYKVESFFDKNTMLLSAAIQKLNGKEITNVKTQKHKSGYHIETLKEKKSIKVKNIQFNICRLYFEEPAGIKEIWLDQFGQMLQIKPAGEHRYQLLLPDGKSNYYSYYKGICTLVEAEIIFGKIKFQLTK